MLEQIGGCRTAIFDKTGTLTYGEPKLTDQLIAPGFLQAEVLTLAASLERTIALQSAVGGMLVSIAGMFLAASGHLSPLGGAISQEVIDVLAVVNALRSAFPPRVINDL